MAQAAKLLGVHLTTVKRMCADGRLRSYRLGEGRQYKVRIRQADLDRVRNGDDWREAKNAEGTRRSGNPEAG